MKNRVDPGRIVYAIEENFKDELSKNWVIWNFIDQASETIQKALGDMDSEGSFLASWNYPQLHGTAPKVIPEDIIA